jgi:hydroxymethylpyrimidine pyrophosphatase-like HAD family hydrolase
MDMVPSDFLAIGDSLNDIQMLTKAGIGVTVANAHPDIKAVAEYVAEKEYGNGFVEAIAQYFTYFRAR